MNTDTELGLSPAERRQFIEHGYVKLEGAIPREFALDVVRQQFAAAGLDPHQPAAWPTGRLSIPPTGSVDLRTLAPRLWSAACALLGGPARTAEKGRFGLANHIIANLAIDEQKPWQVPDDRAPWHKDGYFFRHFLDSPEQALLGIVLWSDVVPQGGGTFIAPESIGVVARYLAAHPEGLHPNGFPWRELMQQCPVRLEAIGAAGDVYLMHSYMLHTQSGNPSRKLRCIDNSVYALAEPMQFNRANSVDFSPVELAVLRGLGLEQYDFRPTRERLRTPDWSPLPPDA